MSNFDYSDIGLLCFTVNFFRVNPRCLPVVYSMYSGIKAESTSNQSRFKAVRERP